MNIKTGLSIYNKPWLVEPHKALQMLDFWEKVRAGNEQWDYSAAVGEGEITKKFTQLFEKDNVIMAPEHQLDLRDFKGFDGAEVVMVPVSGPLMKADFCGWFGTGSLKNVVNQISATDSVHTIIFMIDSPGGTVDGTQAFANAIKESSKRTIALVDGMMCSAAYWIGCSCDEIYASNETDDIGSIGTMCAWYDNTEAMKARGVVLREYYATASVDKNRNFREANAGDGKALIEQELDPVNDVFLQTVRTNRAGKINLEKENVLTGKTYLSKQAMDVGLIDGIQSIEDTLSNVMSYKGQKLGVAAQQKNNNSKSQDMTLEELKASHPETYKAAFKAGVDDERERTKQWLVWHDVDSKAVIEGIEKGEELTKSKNTEFMRKSASQSQLQAITNDNAEEIITGEEETPKTAEAKRDEEIDAAFEKIYAQFKPNK